MFPNSLELDRTNAAMHPHGCAAQVCYLYVVDGRQRDSLSAKAYIR